MKYVIGMSETTHIASPQSQTPRVCFVGFCEILQEVTDRPPSLGYVNLIGLSSTRLFLIYPVHLQGQTAIFSIFEPVQGERLLIHCRPASGKGQDFFLPIDVGFGSVDTQNATQEQFPTGTRLPGWVMCPSQIGGEILITEPGEYKAFQVIEEIEHYIGSFYLVHAVPPPISPEEAAALASDPLARKETQLFLSCKKCGDGIKIYAGLQKNEELESDGWIANNLLSERFICNCNAMDVSLEWLKQGLHASLRPNLGPYLDPSIQIIRMHHQNDLDQQVARFKVLLDSNAPQELLYQFLEAHSIFLSIFAPILLKGKAATFSGFSYDFAVFNVHRELLLIKIDSSDGNHIGRNGGVSAILQRTLDQASDCLRAISEDSKTDWLPFNLEPGQIIKTKAVVLAGRTPRTEIKPRESRYSAMHDVDLYTYDDLLRYIAATAKQMGLSTSSLSSSQEGCYAKDMGDCAGTLSREHYLSSAVLDLLGGTELRVQGLPWLKPGEQITLQARGIVAKILCQKHNSNLSSLDSEVASFLRTIYICTRGGIQGAISLEDLCFEFDGSLIERWMLKVICGAIASGAHRGQSRNVPRRWVEVLYQKRPWPQEFTFYLLQENYYKVPEHDHVSVDFIPDDSGEFVKGITFHFMCFNMTLALGRYTGVPGIPRASSKMEVGMKSEEREVRVKLRWPDDKRVTA
jgi:hypothetical protein